MPMGLDAAIRKRVSGEFRSEVGLTFFFFILAAPPKLRFQKGAKIREKYIEITITIPSR
jgi:hypothetical protein